MHKALTLGDVVAEIVVYLDQGSLAAVARTCKTLSNPALDALWRIMTCLDPLYMTLPEGVWTRQADGTLVPGPTVPAPEVWVRFLAYASRIRELSFGGIYPHLWPGLLTLMLRHSPSLLGPPLPRLNTLRIDGMYPAAEVALCLAALVHPRLRKLNIVWPSPELAAAMLAFMQPVCPDVQEFKFDSARGLLPIAARFTRLRSLICDDPDTVLDTRLLMALSRFPHLSYLCVTSQFTSASTTKITENETDDLFPGLKDLSLTNVTDVSAVAQFLRAIKSRSLKSLTLDYTRAQQTAHELRALADSIALHKDLSGLSMGSQEPPADGVAEQDIAALGTLKRLRQVCFANVPTYENPECATFDLLLSWPDIERMHLDCSAWRSPQHGAIPALEHLEKLLAACPRLTELHTALAVTTISAAPGLARARRAKPLHLTVVLPASKFTTVDPYDVAEYLSDVCPALEVACDEAGGAQFANFRDRWLKVNGWIARINAVRAAERRRMEA